MMTTAMAKGCDSEGPVKVPCHFPRYLLGIAPVESVLLEGVLLEAALSEAALPEAAAIEALVLAVVLAGAVLLAAVTAGVVLPETDGVPEDEDIETAIAMAATATTPTALSAMSGPRRRWFAGGGAVGNEGRIDVMVATPVGAGPW